MEFVIITFLVASILTNIYLAQNLKEPRTIIVEQKWEPLPIEVGQLECCHCSIKTETIAPISKSEDNEKYQAWKNTTYEPIKASPSPHKPPPKPGPMERPSGFAL